MIQKKQLLKLKDNFLTKKEIFKNHYFYKCEVCGSKKNEALQSYGRIASNYKYGILPISICKDCGYVFLNPRLPNKFYKKYYKKNYRDKKNNNMLLNKAYELNQINRGAKAYDYFIKKIKPKKLKMLDHGCANGLTMSKWKENGWKCIGIDPHSPSVETGVKKFKFDIRKLDGESLHKLNHKFGLVLSLGSLEHSYDLNKSLKNIHKVLINSGYLIIRYRSENMVGSPLEYFNHNHFRYLNKLTWKYVLQKHKFKVDKFIKIPVEGSDMYNYIITRKTNKQIKQEFNSKNNFKNYMLKYKNSINKYFDLAKKIKKKKLKNFKDKEKFIEDNMIGILSINRKKAINRVFIESSKFLSFINKI